MHTADTIDYKQLYEQEQLKVAALTHELSQLKKLLFGSKQERFVAEPTGAGAVIQGRLDLHPDVIAACQITLLPK